MSTLRKGSKITIVLCLLALTTTAYAGDPNGAIRFLMAIGHIPAAPVSVLNEFVDLNSPEAIGNISAEARKILRTMQSKQAFNLVIVGSQQPDCNFTPDNVLPEPTNPVAPYRALRTLARICAAQAWLLEKDGKKDEAFDLLLALVGMGSQISRHELLIGAMIGKAVSELGIDSLKVFLKRHPEPIFREKIAKYLSTLPRPLINIMGALEKERGSFTWIQRVLAKPDFKMEEVVSGMGGESDFSRRLAKLIGTPELEKMNQEVLALYDSILAIPATDPDLEKKLDEISKKAGLNTSETQTNIWFEITVSNFSHVGHQIASLEQKVNELLKQ